MTISSEARDYLRQHLIVDEGLRLRPYTDTVGKLTIGVGRNLTDVGITAIEAYDMLDHDIDHCVVALETRYPWFSDLDPVRQVVLANLCFNMGIKGLSKFVNTLAAVKRGDYTAAANGLRASKWHRQVQASRSSRLIRMMVTGQWPRASS